MRRAGSVASSAVAVVVAMVGFASSARADLLVVGSNGSGLSASANFAINGNNLVITLTNTSSADVLVPAQVLTAVFFSTPGGLTPVSALLAGGSVVNGGPNGGGNVGGEWGYANGINVSGSNSGISSAGFGVFGDANFNGSNLDDPTALNGLNYGIVSAGDDPTSGNGGVLNDPLIQNSVVFTLSGWNANWSLSDITNVFFQYGTALSEPNLAVPEPGVIALMTIGLIGFAFAARKMSWA